MEPRGSVSVDDQVKDDELEEDFAATDKNDDDGTSTPPFSTPCASPPFYTPSPSPVRDDLTNELREESLHG